MRRVCSWSRGRVRRAGVTHVSHYDYMMQCLASRACTCNAMMQCNAMQAQQESSHTRAKEQSDGWIEQLQCSNRRECDAALRLTHCPHTWLGHGLMHDGLQLFSGQCAALAVCRMSIGGVLSTTIHANEPVQNWRQALHGV